MVYVTEDVLLMFKLELMWFQRNEDKQFLPILIFSELLLQS